MFKWRPYNGHEANNRHAPTLLAQLESCQSHNHRLREVHVLDIDIEAASSWLGERIGNFLGFRLWRGLRFLLADRAAHDDDKTLLRGCH